MRRVLLLIFFSGILFPSYAQKKVNAYLEAYNAISLDVLFSNEIIIDGGLNIGTQINLPQSSINAYVIYQFDANSKSLLNHNRMTSNFVGAGIGYILGNATKPHQFSFQFEMLTEVYSSYSGKYLSGDPITEDPFFNFWLTPQEEPSQKHNLVSGFSGNPYAYYYVSSPLKMQIMPSYKLRLSKSFNLSVGFGIGLRAYKVRYKQWNANDPEPIADLSQSRSLKTNPNKLERVSWDLLLSYRIGLQYHFPTKNKK